MSDSPYDLAYTLAGTKRANPYDARRRFASQMLQSGSDYSPVAHPLQGAARLAQALVGGWIGNKADEDERTAAKDRHTKLAGAIAKMRTDPEGGLADAASLDPEYGLRAASQLAVEKVKLGQQRAGLGAVADGYGSPGGVSSSPLPAAGGLGNAGQAIAGIESAGGPNNGYGAVGPVANSKGNRAYGKYQVLDTNIGPWTQEILGQAMTPQEFLANPQAQDAVFKAKFGQYQQQYGSAEAASRAWFAGPGGMNNPGAADVNGMTVDRYGKKFAQAYGPGAGGQAPPTAPPVTVQATPPGQPQPLQINMPQGAAETNGMPPTPSPQGVSGPTMMAPPVPPQRMTPRDMPREMAAPYIDRLRRGGYGTNPAEAEQRMVADMQRGLDVSFENRKLEYERLRGDYEYGRKHGDDQRGADLKRGDDRTRQTFEFENKLRADFNSAPAVKAYRTVVPMLESAKDATTRPTRAADLNLVYAFAKLMDPDSVVRESETGAVVATQSVMDRIGSYIGQLNGQAMLNADARAKLIQELDSRFNSLKSSYDAHEEAYKGIAERNGLNFDNVRIPVRGSQPGGRNDYAANAPSNEELRQKSSGTPGAVPVYDMNGKRLR